MLSGLITSYLDKRMAELGHCQGYAVRLRHYVIQPSGTLEVAAWGELFVLVEDVQDLRIESDRGVYDTATPDTTSEQQHEHSGQIFLENLASDCACHVRFIQAIPLEPVSECPPCNNP